MLGILLVRSLLSPPSAVLRPGLPPLCEHPHFPPGIRRGDYWRRGVCVAVSEDGCFDVRPLPTTGSGRLNCFIEDRVPADRVRHTDSLICTKHEVQTAANLAMDRFPGARRDVISRSGWTRIGIERAALTAAFLRDPSVVVQASRSPARSKKAPADAPPRRVRRSRRPFRGSENRPFTDVRGTAATRPCAAHLPRAH